MKVLLVNPPIREWAKPNIFPLGLGYIASVLRDAGYQVEAMDINALRWEQEEVEAKISSMDFDIVGIGAIVTIYWYVKWLIAVFKKYHPDKKVIIGGSVGASIPEIIFKKTAVDIICMGEGESTMVTLMEVLENHKDLATVEGIWFRGQNGKICRNKDRMPIKDLDSIPFPAWDLFPMEVYLKNPIGAPNRNKWVDGTVTGGAVLSMNISGTRGCPYQCIYCYHDFMGCKYRHRSARNIIEEMSILFTRYGVEYFHFIDDEFCLNRSFVYDFCKLVKKEFKNKVTWGCTGRVNLMTEELVASMADAGCNLIGYGIESGSQKMLDVMKKGVTVKQSEKAIKLTRKFLGWADCSFMIGTPGENQQTIQETIDFCKELDLTPEVIFFITPYPGTELYEIALSQGKIIDEEEYVLGLGEQGERIRVNFTEFSDEELFKAQERMIKQLNAWNKVKHPESR